jgi:hypothetical protein
MSPEERQRVADEEHLRLLALFHYISGGMTVAFSAMFGLMIGMMSLAFSFIPPHAGRPCANEDPCAGAQLAPEPFPQAFFFWFFGVALVLTLILGVLEIISGRCISKRRRRVFSIVVSIPRILSFPYGTLLSIFTLLVLERRTVKELYAPGPAIGL